MNQSRTQLVFFSIGFVAIIIFTLLIFQSFLATLVLASMMAVILGPVYKKTLKEVRGNKTLAAILTMLFLLLVILLPLTFLGGQILGEAQTMYAQVASGSSVSIDQINNVILKNGQKIYPEFTFDIRTYLAVFSGWIVAHLGGFFTGTFDFIFKLFLSFIALFYFLRDGDVFKKQLMSFSPLADEDDISILESLKSTINSVVLGSLIVAVVQGIVAGIGLTIFGVPNALLWATTAGIVSFVPGVGTALVWIPATIYLFFARAGYYWLGELLWSMVIVALIDNFLSPNLIERGIKIHPLLILFSILGGLAYFGPEGLLLGPLVLSLLFALVRVYQKRTSPSKVVDHS